MKLRHSLLLALPLFALPALSFAAEGGCATKAQNIQQQIDYATQHGNTHRVDGLKKALSEVQNNCTEAGLQAERQKKIDEKQTKVAERQQELKTAQQTGNLDKVAKKQQKLAQAQAELKQAQAE
ncbi:Protein of uncharacterised function (DUF1090) [Serratia entomophila]|jgi:uncharacterized membrane protein (DUF106 family)|uniref:DUF1090 domain-containing protein n=1 Tax=Serratia entomophila TaxID=42906 RepID=A0ABY5CQN5_9GAMM|nr:DUF1090 domain-containing protein [Serratia entomophila]UIW17852.1 DUF1090 domain-containing protein [Serratia entomophila]USV00448.1 DUF1090 domain-containing protein [Serratia entomophila]CAI0700213.1 Protein of uncharacterised function (DUF1090) [Serratia entomophila]CAI0756975.1 Protein of uncharacterised function (DUF1090) [Serratia entomophila]CAI0921931.1 Protein of uncharacterised function (DUF1090) [Serratia entomophila]